ncbi:MAG: hypothetical protein Q8L98_04760 [Chlamydiales bacterium]|nr:hypothetical protein [Chlamydiales bacterium]
MLSFLVENTQSVKSCCAEDSCRLRIGVLGMNFKTASLEVREQIARAVDSLVSETGMFFPYPTVVLSTCNRTEIYFGGGDLASIHTDLLAWLRFSFQESFECYFYSYFGIDCFLHLSRVTVGLDSANLTETEIQRQVKVAYEQATNRFCLPPALHYAFQKSLKVAKEVRNQFPLHRGNVQLSSMIWRLAGDFFTELPSKKILFVGYSELNRQLLASFMRRGVFDITLCTKNPATIPQLAYPVVGRDVLESWFTFDLIICASKAGQYLIQGRGYTNRLLFDLSVPRNVDPLVGERSRLYNMEQINALIQEEIKQRQVCLSQSEELLKNCVHRLALIYRNKNLV